MKRGMLKAYQEYLELFEYFGRGGLPKLDMAEFTKLAEEFDEMVAQDAIEPEQIARLVELKELLLRDRPRLAQIKVKT